MTQPVVAPSCSTCSGRLARLTDGREIYPHRSDLHDKPIWKCDGCGGYVGCHPGSTRSLGTPADAALRFARSALHDRMIDPLWHLADMQACYHPEDEAARSKIRKAARSRTYAYLAEQLDLSRDECHTAMFDLVICRRAWTALRGVSPEHIRAWSPARSKRLA